MTEMDLNRIRIALIRIKLGLRRRKNIDLAPGSDTMKMEEDSKCRRRSDAEEEGHWITTKSGRHVFMNGEGEPTKGNPQVIAAMKGEGSKPKRTTASGSTKTGSSSGASTSTKTKYVSASTASKAKTIGGYTRKNVFKNGYGTTAVDFKDRESDSGITMKANTNDKGEWTEEREALHSKIIDDTFEGVKKASGKPVTTFMGGGPASGKSYVVKHEAENLNLPKDNERVLVDPDKCKKPLPEYDEDNPSPVHEESSALAKRITKIAQENGYNVLVDGTGDGSVEKMRKKIQQAKDAGHTVRGVYVFKPVEAALVANGERDRTVNPEEVVKTHKAISSILPEIAKDFDDVKLYANMKKGEPPVLIASGGGGKGLTIHDQKLYDMFLANRDYEYNEERAKRLTEIGKANKAKKKSKK